MKMNKLLALMLVLALALSTCIFAYAENASAIPEIPAELIRLYDKKRETEISGEELPNGK